MPVNVGYFTIRQPRVASINAATTSPPTASGSYSFLDGFNLSYTGSADKCFLYITGTKILTLCNDDQNHPDNLNLSTEGLTLEELIQVILRRENYSCEILSNKLSQRAYLEGVIKHNLKSNAFKVRYNSEKEFFIEVSKRGNRGSASVNIKEDNFSFEGLLNKWSIEDGFIHDYTNINTPSNGVVNIPNNSVQINFKAALNSSSVDLENLVKYSDLELIKSTDQFISSLNFQAASILVSTFSRMSNPNIKPPASSRSIAWSQDNSFLAVGHSNAPYVTIYKRTLNNFNRLNVNFTPSGIGESTSLSWSKDNKYLAVGYDLNPFIDIYKLENEILTKITNIPSQDLPKGKCLSMSWSPDSSILSVSHDLAPFLTHYKVVNDVFTKVNLNDFVPLTPFKSIAWSNNGEFLICSQILFPHIVIYKKAGDGLFFITFNGELPPGPTHSLAWDEKDQYLVAAHENFPFVTIYKRSSSVFTKLDNPFILPQSACFSASWSPNSEYFSLGLDSSPFIITYKRIGDTFERLENPSPLPNSPANQILWSPNGKYFSVTQTQNPFVLNYEFSKDFELKINQEIAFEGINYKLDLGIKPIINSKKSSPYVFNSSNNILKIRWNSDNVQSFNFPLGLVSVKDLISIINSKSNNFIAQSFVDSSGEEFLYLEGKKGTANHQLRIEDGSANEVFGFTDFESKKGSGFGEIVFLKRVEEENLSQNIETDSLVLSGFETSTENPFLGIDVDSVSISENDSFKKLNIDFIVDSSGNINLIKLVEEENLIKNIFKKDNDLYQPSFTLYKNGTPLVENLDYVVNPQGGWFNLEEGAFPGDTFTVDYINSVFGKINNEIIIGEPAILRGSLDGPFDLGVNSNEFIVYIDNGDEQKFTLPSLSSISANQVALIINETALNFKCLICNNKLELRTDSFGGKSNIRIGNGSANVFLGFSNNQSISGVGAEGGETALEVSNPPMDIISFSAPQFGNTIIIKNNNVADRYQVGSLIKLDNNYYQVDTVNIENKANIVSSVPGPFTIISDSNDIFTFQIDDEDEISVTFTEDTNVSVFDIVNQINSLRPLTAKVFSINGSNKIQIIGSQSVKIGFGSANRTLGFDDDDSDTNTPDTYIKISGEFKTTYAAPTIYTTVNAIDFLSLNSENLETPPGSSIIKVIGDITDKISSNKMLRISGLFYYKVISANLNDEGVTEITVNEKLDIPIFSDSSIDYSNMPIYEEDDVLLKTDNFIYLESPHIIKKNGSILQVDIDYGISENGEIELSDGVKYGDLITINYTARRFIDSDTQVKASYSYFDFIPLKTNLIYSFQAQNPDCFYINILHGSTILKRTVEEVSQNVQGSLSSGSTGFPTGEVPVTENDASGVTTFNYTLGAINDKINLSLKVYEFYDERTNFFEIERRSLNGWIVGAESGRVTSQQIINSATLQPPQRLFPTPDNRPFEERSKPLRVPALNGENKNDAGSANNGISPAYLLTDLNQEKNILQNLLSISPTQVSLASTGNISGIRGETIIIYVEARSGNNLLQRTVSIQLPTRTTSTFGGITTTTDPSPSSVASAINSAINSAFSSITVTPATSDSSRVYLNASSANPTKCCLIIQDTPNLGFGVGNQASIRSRHTSYTAGSIYTDATVPGLYSSHISNLNQINSNSLQITGLEGQMQEWLGSFEQSFIEAKNETIRLNLSLNEVNQFIEIKFGAGIFNSIDSNSVLNDRIAKVNRRINEVTSRLQEISQSLSREGLYNARYSWLVYLADKSIGFYAARTREIDQQAKRSLDATDGLELLNSVNNLF
jgi:hypothetical protein